MDDRRAGDHAPIDAPATERPGSGAPPVFPLADARTGDVVEQLALDVGCGTNWNLLLALMGYNPRAPGDWDSVRALITTRLRTIETARPLANMVTGGLAILMLRHHVPLVHLALVAVLGLLCSGLGWWTGRRRAVLSRPTITRRQMRLLNVNGLVNAVPWAVLFAISGPLPADLSLIMFGFIAVQALGAVHIGAALPLAVGGFTLIGGGAAFVRMVVDGHVAAAAATVMLLLMLLAITTRAVVIQVQLMIARIGLSEKSETVRLLLREYADASADWLWQTDASRRLVQVTPRLAHALGRPIGQLEGMPLLQALAGDSWADGRFADALHDLADRMGRMEHFTNFIVPMTIGGTSRWCALSASPRLGDGGRVEGYRGVGSDVTDAQMSAEKIERMARFDALTGLPNRQSLTEALSAALEASVRDRHRCALIICDLDRFKTVNDTLGHPVGDRLLTQVAQRLTALMAPGRHCGRLGGDEFGIVVDHARTPAEVSALGETIIEALSEPYVIDTHHIYVGASAGFALGPLDGGSVDTLTRNADLALYRSKDRGGGVVHQYEPALHADAEERRVMEVELRTALERRELSLDFQPVVNAADGTLDGFEALLRWTNGRLGPVSPARFVPVAEDARLIAPMGEWVLRAACAEAMRWPSNLKIAVNVSADQLSDAGFAGIVISALAQSGLPPERLELEVTESVFLRDGGQAARVLDRLLALGIRLSLDDFGTGYSSLGYLHKTRFSTIKIDRSFVQGAARDKPESLAIIRAVVALADSLGMTTTAEGAETEDEVATVRALGCSKIQGYFYGRPMAGKDVDRLFNRHAPPRAAA